MAEEDALISLAVDDAQLMGQFERIEQALQKLGGGGISSTLAGGFDKLSLALDSSTLAMIRLQEGFSNLSRVSVSSNSARENAAKSATTAEQNLTRAIKERQDVENRTVNYSSLGGNPWESREGSSGPNYETFGGNPYSEARLKQIQLDKESSVSAERATQTQIDSMLKAQAKLIENNELAKKLEAGRTADIESQVQRRIEAEDRYIAKLQKDQQELVEQSARQKELGSIGNRLSSNTSYLPGNDVASLMQEEQYAGVRKSLEDRERYVRDLKSQIESVGGLSPFGKQNGLEKSELKEINDLIQAQGLMLQARPSLLEKELGYTGRMLISWTAMGVVFESLNAAAHMFNKSIQEASNVQVQGVLFQGYKQALVNSGQQTDATQSNTVMQEAVRLAATYGDNVSDVLQDLELWYKRTGDLASASWMTGQALKFQVATGTELEDTYRTLTALGSQLTGEKMGGGLGGTFDLSKTKEFLSIITAAAVEGGAGLHVFTSKGVETDKNSAKILIEAMEKDAAALKSLGFNLIQTVALNQALITSMGNTGPAASDAAEKIGRLAGGLASLSDPGKTKKLQKIGIDLSGLTTVDTDEKRGNVLIQLGSIYEGLVKKTNDHGVALRNNLAVAVAGNRQYESLIAIIENLGKAHETEIKILKNLGLEDQLAMNMQDTYQQAVKRLGGAWEGLEISLGQRILPALTSGIINFTENGIPALNNMMLTVGGLSGAFIGLFSSWATVAALPLPPQLKAVLTIASTVGGAVAGHKADVEAQENRDLGEAQANRLRSTEAYENTRRVRDLHLQDRFHPYGRVDGADLAEEDARQAKTLKDAQDFKQKRMNALALIQANLAPAGSNIGYTERGDPTADSKQMRFLSRGDYLAKHLGLENNETYQTWHTNEILHNRGINTAITSGEASAAVAEQLKKINGKGDPNEGGPLALPNSGTPLKDYQVLGQALSDLKNKYEDKNQTLKDSLATDDRTIANTQRLAQIYGPTAARLKELTAETEKKRKDENATLSFVNSQIPQFEALAKQAKAKEEALKAANGSVPTEESRGWHTVWSSASGEVRRLTGEATTLHDALLTLNDPVLQLAENLAKVDLGKLTKADDLTFNALSKSFSGSKVISEKIAIAAQMVKEANNDYTAELKKFYTDYGMIDSGTNWEAAKTAIEDRHQQRLDTATGNVATSGDDKQNLLDSLEKLTAESKSKGLDSLLTIAGGGNPETEKQLGYLKQAIALQKEKSDFEVDYKKKVHDAGDDPALLNSLAVWHDTKEAEFAATDAADQYKKKLEEIQLSPWYKGLETFLTDAAKALSTSIDDSLFGNNKLQSNITTIDQTITALDNKKNLEEEMYGLSHTHSAMDEANHKVALTLINQRIAAEKQLAQAEKDKLDHPQGLRGMLQGFTKSFTDSYLKQVQDSLMGNLLKDPKSDTIKKELETYVKSADANVSALDRNTAALLNPSSALNDNSGALNDTSKLPHFSGSYDVPGKTDMGGGSSIENMLKSGGLLTALGLSIGGHSGIGSALGLIGGQFKGGASTGKFGAGADLSMLGTIAGSFGESTDAGVGSLLGTGLGLLLKGVGGPAGAMIGSLLGGMLGPHYNAQKNPDMFGSDFGQEEANLTGKAYTSSGGNAIIDPTLKAGLGGKTKLQYLDDFVKAHANGNGLTGESLDLWKKLNIQTGGGSATQLGYGGIAGALHNGQQQLMDSAGKAIGAPTSVKDLYTSLDNATQSVEQFQGALNGSQQSLVIFNNYGGNPRAGWNLPGYSMPSGNYNSSNSNITTNNVPSTPTVNQSRTTQPILLNANMQVDGKTLATITQSYAIRANNSGYANIT